MDPDRYYIRLRGKTRGPYAIDQLQRLVSRGQFSRLYQVSTDRQVWTSASQLSAVFGTGQSEAKTSSAESALSFVSDEQWYYAAGDQRLGPVSRENLLNLLSSGGLTGKTLVWRDGLSDWLPAESVLTEATTLASKGRGASSLVRQGAIAVVSLICIGTGVFFWMQPRPGDQNNSTQSQPIEVASVSVATPAPVVPTPEVAQAPAVPSPAEASTPTPQEPPPPAPPEPSTPMPPPATSPNQVGEKGEIASTDFADENVSDQLNQAVGMVVSYLEIDMHDGVHHELWLGHGTCFVVNSQGYALTNRHVIKNHQEWIKATEKGRIGKLREMHLELFPPQLRREKKVEAFLKQCYAQVASITPRCVTYFGKKGRSSKVHFVSSDFDMAVLEIEGLTDSPWFSLCSDNVIPKLTPVIAVGFPGVSQLAVTEAEAAILQGKSGTSLNEKLFGTADHRDAKKSAAFELTPTTGDISVVQQESGGFAAQSTAPIRPGNSGGPLLFREGRRRGTVFAINTLFLRDDSPVYVAFPVAQMQKELTEEAKVPDLKFH